MPRRSLRLRVGGLTLAVEAARPTGALDPPPGLEPFLTRRAGDIRLSLTADPAPAPEGDRLFDSGGVWRVHRHSGGLLYDFHVPRRRPPVYKAVVIDAGLSRGRLHFPAIEGGPEYALDYPLDELLFQHRLAREGAVEVHACGVVWRSRALVLCGRSGAGKSTTARLWRRHTRGTRILSDDRIVLRPVGRGARAWGTPWHGDGGFALPESGPLGALFFLRHGRRSEVRPLARAEAAARLLARSFPPPWDPVAMGRALETCAAVTAAVPAFDLAFRPDRSAVDAVREVVDHL
ncbi:MAG: hypothetical protein LJF30_07410 [Acidobacteria bacterium]|nr:hypothetical protein [Acidobacteriota bacterium]